MQRGIFSLIAAHFSLLLSPDENFLVTSYHVDKKELEDVASVHGREPRAHDRGVKDGRKSNVNVEHDREMQRPLSTKLPAYFESSDSIGSPAADFE